MLLVVMPCLIHAEVLYLKDGSTIKGELVRVEGDTLHFKVSFGGQLKFAKDKVLWIQFSDSIPPIPTRGSGDRPGFPGMSSAEPGSLIVAFDGLELSNKIIVHRNRDYAAHESANAIESILLVDEQPVASYIDSTTDKIVRKGADTELKNTIRFADFRVQLEPGPHSCTLVVRNRGRNDYKNAFEHAPFNLTLDVGDIIIYPERDTRVEIGAKRGFLRLGAPKLFVK